MPAGTDLLLLAERIYPSTDAAPARALLIRGGRVVVVGSEGEARAAANGVPRVESFPDCTVTAGFTDSHVHLSTWAVARRGVSLGGARSVEEAVERVRTGALSLPERAWVTGHGWQRDLWDRPPTRGDLDRLFPDRPVLLDSHDIHAAWLNSAALRHCGIDRDTPDPEGGRIERDPSTGEATGVLFEAARAMGRSFVPAPAREELFGALLDAQVEALRLGITAVHSVEFDGLRDFSDMEARGALKLRVLQHLPLDRLEDATRLGLRSGFGGERLRVGGVKMFLDGSLGSRTAWLRQPYEGSTSDHGMQTLSGDDFRDAVRLAATNGLATAVHGIGDAAVDLAITVLAAIPPPPGLPHRIEHLQLCPPGREPDIARAGIVASMQPVHLLTDIPAAERGWGHPRSAGAYAFAPLLQAGVVLAFGSDIPVETIDPRPGLFAATRRAGLAAFAGEVAVDPWYPENCLTPREAVAAYTEGPALAAREQYRRGRLLPGFDADLVVWSGDPLAPPNGGYRSIECLLTMIAGEVVHRAE